MFTGIIKDLGEVAAIEDTADRTLTIATKLPLADMEIGASIACNGICLTAIEIEGGRFKVQASAETIAKTTLGTWRPGTTINLERPLRAGDELGGHMVSGHIDGVAEILERKAEGGSARFVLRPPQELMTFIAPKGSVALDGVSLTVNDVLNDSFGINIIPHTQTCTNFGALRPGDRVNLEIDLMARYLARMIGRAPI
ncbi:MAG: riboflavin synthase [Alphaproteobacteria bacterium]